MRQQGPDPQPITVPAYPTQLGQARDGTMHADGRRAALNRAVRSVMPAT
ncbi:hypothetical protein [Actinomadura macra]|nr:hypothetical protein [Actinomadura macra]